MTAAPVEVEDWTKQGKSFEPAMTATVGAGPGDALDAIAAGLESQGYKVKDRTAAGFTASHRKLVSGILGLATGTHGDLLDRTLLEVTTSPADGGTLVTIAVKGGGEHRAGRKGGASGLTAALQDLQRRGVPVTTTPWAKVA